MVSIDPKDLIYYRLSGNDRSIDVEAFGTIMMFANRYITGASYEYHMQYQKPFRGCIKVGKLMLFEVRAKYLEKKFATPKNHHRRTIAIFQLRSRKAEKTAKLEKKRMNNFTFKYIH